MTLRAFLGLILALIALAGGCGIARDRTAPHRHLPSPWTTLKQTSTPPAE